MTPRRANSTQILLFFLRTSFTIREKYSWSKNGRLSIFDHILLQIWKRELSKSDGIIPQESG